MDRDDQLIITALKEIRSDLNANHLDVCQRLTALETAQSTQPDLIQRVNALEKWQGKIAGGLAVISLIFTTAAAMLFRKFK